MPDKQRTVKTISAERAMIAANRFILFHYPTMFTGALPLRLSLSTADLWVVPIVLTHSEHGVVGEVGVVALQAQTGEVMGHTPRAQVVAAGKRLREAGKYALETALLSARPL